MAGLVNSVSSTNPNGYTSTIPGQPGYDDGSSASSTLNTAKSYYSTPAPAAQIASQGYTPTNWDVSQDQTVEGRINGLTDPNSAMNVKAATEATQTAAARGLVNSSLAVTAGQDAVLKNALPIAQQDANTYASSAQFNAGAKNSAAQFGANAANVANLTGADINQRNYSAELGADTQLATNKATNDTQLAANKLTNDTSVLNTKTNSDTQQFVANLNSATSLATSKLSAETQTAIAGMDNASKSQLQDVISSNSQLLQASTSAANLVTQYSTNIGNIQMSTTMDAAAKQQAVSNQLNILKASLAAIGAVSGLNLSQYFEPVDTNAPATDTGGDTRGQDSP